MAHHLVTQVEEDQDSTRIPLGPLANSSSHLGGGGGGGLDGQRDGDRRASPPQGCWRAIMSYFCVGAKAQQQQQQQQQQQHHQHQLQPLAKQLSPTSTPSPPSVSRPPHSSPFEKYLLPPLPDSSTAATRARKCLVLDLDETLVHSSFKPIPNPDFVLTIDLDGVFHKVFVRKRPGVDYFLRHCARRFELVIFTASLSKYADPLLDILDPERLISARLFRESCVLHFGSYVKDLTHLGRPIEHTLIVDNSPLSYLFQPENAVPCTSWFQDKNDLQLYEMLPFLDIIADCHNVVPTIAREKALCKYTFFGPTLTPPKIVLPLEVQQQQQQEQQQQQQAQTPSRQLREIKVSVS